MAYTGKPPNECQHMAYDSQSTAELTLAPSNASLNNPKASPTRWLADTRFDILTRLLLLFGILAMISLGLAVTSLTQMQTLNRNNPELTGPRSASAAARLATRAVNVNPENPEETAVAAKTAYEQAITLALCGAGVSLITGLGLGIGWLSIRTLRRQLGSATVAVEAMTQGDFTSNLEPATKGEVGRLMQALNGMRAQLQQFVAAELAMVKQDKGGSIDQRIVKGHFPGAYGAMADGINHAIANEIALQRQIVETVRRYAKGDFSADWAALPGETAQIGEAVGGIKADLQSISTEVLCLVEAAAHGDFSGRGEARKYEYAFRNMVESLNRLMDTNESGMNDVAEILSSMAKGDLARVMEGDYEGSHGQLQYDVNLTVEQLSRIVAKIREAIVTIKQREKSPQAAWIFLRAPNNKRPTCKRPTARWSS